MPAKKQSKTKTKTKKPATAKKAGARHADAYCKGECRLRTKGMKVNDVRRRVTNDGKKLKIIRVA